MYRCRVRIYDCNVVSFVGRCMGRLGDWDKVERKKRPIKFTKQDEFWEYFKMFIYILLAGVYCYYLFV